jgi:hypothetical protein
VPELFEAGFLPRDPAHDPPDLVFGLVRRPEPASRRDGH